MKTNERTSRRSFLKTASVFMAPAIVPASVFGQGNRPAPSERSVVAALRESDIVVLGVLSHGSHHGDGKVRVDGASWSILMIAKSFGKTIGEVP